MNYDFYFIFFTLRKKKKKKKKKNTLHHNDFLFMMFVTNNKPFQLCRHRTKVGILSWFSNSHISTQTCSLFFETRTNALSMQSL